MDFTDHERRRSLVIGVDRWEHVREGRETLSGLLCNVLIDESRVKLNVSSLDRRSSCRT